MISDTEIRSKCAQYPLRSGFYKELDSFLDARIKYMAGNGPHTDVLHWYEMVYTSLKAMWVSGLIRESDFWLLTEMIGEK